MESENLFQKITKIPVIGPPLNGFIGLLLPLGVYYFWLQEHFDAGKLGAGILVLGWNGLIIYFFRVLYKMSLLLGSLLLLVGIYDFLGDTLNLSSGVVILVMIAAAGIFLCLFYCVMTREEGDKFFDPLNDILRLFRGTRPPELSEGISAADAESITAFITQKTDLELISITEVEAGVLVRAGWVSGDLWTLSREGESWGVVQKEKHKRGKVVVGGEEAVDLEE